MRGCTSGPLLQSIREISNELYRLRGHGDYLFFIYKALTARMLRFFCKEAWNIELDNEDAQELIMKLRDVEYIATHVIDLLDFQRGEVHVREEAVMPHRRVSAVRANGDTDRRVR